MGLFGGGNSSTSQRTENTSQNNAVSDNSGLVVSNLNKSNLTLTDRGAVDSAFQFASESQAFLGESFSSVLGLIEKTTGDAIDGVRESGAGALAQVSDSQTSGTTKLAAMGVGAFALALGAAAIIKAK